jgi:hypothetical protein
MATTTPNFGWAVPTSTDLVKDGAVAIETLGDSIDASLVDLKGGTTGQVLAKASGTDMDFSWVAQDDSNAIQNAIVDAKGDLIGATAADTPARLAVGTNGQVLTADSTAATGLKWAASANDVGTWTTYSPTLSNLTVGNGTQIARYQKVGKTVNVFYQLTLGSTSTVGNTPNITLPSTPVQANFYAGSLNMIDSGNTTFMGQALITGGALYPQAIQSNGTYTNAANVTSTVPMTWTTSDVLTMQLSYEES